MHLKDNTRLRRSKKTRAKIKELGAIRLSVYRSSNHIYAQVISVCGNEILASASTLDKDLRSQITHGGNIAAAAIVGKAVAERAKAKGVEEVAFDRSGYKYHGRIQALADSAREAGLQF